VIRCWRRRSGRTAAAWRICSAPTTWAAIFCRA
jgi:hypothetical protein